MCVCLREYENKTKKNKKHRQTKKIVLTPEDLSNRYNCEFERLSIIVIFFCFCFCLKTGDKQTVSNYCAV